MNKVSLSLLLALSACLISSCGGGSSDSGILLEGLLTQGEEVVHSASATLRHAANENIEDVEICALGECATTDSAGEWGFVAPESFIGGSIQFTIKGHGIDSTSEVTVPEGAQAVYVHFENSADGHVIVHHKTVDGVEVEADGHDHE